MSKIIFGENACVLNANNMLVETVVLCREEDSETWEPYKYALQPGEHLALHTPPLQSDICKHRLVDGAWVEAATDEEKATWQAYRESDQPTQSITLEQRVEAVENAVLDIVRGSE